MILNEWYLQVARHLVCSPMKLQQTFGRSPASFPVITKNQIHKSKHPRFCSRSRTMIPTQLCRRVLDGDPVKVMSGVPWSLYLSLTNLENFWVFCWHIQVEHILGWMPLPLVRHVLVYIIPSCNYCMKLNCGPRSKFVVVVGSIVLPTKSDASTFLVCATELKPRQ